MNPTLKNKILVNLRNYVREEKKNHKNGLMSHQVIALERTHDFLLKPNGAKYGIAFTADESGKEEKGIKKGDFFEIISATGTGKTRIFGSLAHACDVPTLILTPRNVINKQTKQEFCEEIGINPDEVGVYDSKQPNKAKKLALGQKYLITTYQSLPSLMRNGSDFSNKHGSNYRPLVILDEVHKGQGHEQSKAVRKFLHKCMVVGLTATDAGAQESLFEGQPPIFKLPIVPAIQQDLLCEGVRAGVIDVNIDEEWLKSFKPPSSKSDYRKEDIHKFATNPAIVKGAIDFHLKQDDEQLGKLNRLPTIFFTQGVDAAEMGAEIFNKMAKKQGIAARADFVSGEMPAKERDEKLLKFKNGEIQALWNDAVLEMGFNDKNATVCYSLKPSVMPHVVEQQMGRITRKPEKYYEAKYGHNKIALAINVRAPGMNPILFGEVLGGAPAVYSTAHPKAPSKPKKVPKAKNWPDDIAVHVDYDDMHEVLSAVAKKRERDKGKPENVWSSVELGQAMGMVGATPYIKKIDEYFAMNPQINTMQLLNIDIPRSALVEYVPLIGKTAGEPVKGILKEYGLRLAQEYRRSLTEDGKPESVWSAPEFAEALDAGIDMAKSIIENMQLQVQQGKSATYLGVPISATDIISYVYNQKQLVGIRKDTGQRIAEAYNRSLCKPSNVWSSVELSRELDLDESRGHDILSRLLAQSEADPKRKTFEYKGKEFPKECLVKYQVAKEERLGIRADEGAMLVQVHKANMDMQKEYSRLWYGADFGKALNSPSLATGVIAMIRKQASDDSLSVIKVKGVEIPRTAPMNVIFRGRISFGIPEEYALKLLRAYGITDVQKALKEKHYPVISEPRSITPDSPHIRDRRGRSRGKDD